MDVRLDAIALRSLLRELEDKARTPPDVVRLDLSGLDDIDPTGVATLRVATRRLRGAGLEVELHGASPRVAHILDDTPVREPPPPPRALGTFERVGESAIATWRGLVALADMFVETMRGVGGAMIGHRSFSGRDTADQVERMGSDAMTIVALLSFLLGLVLTFQTYVQLHSFGTDSLVLDFVGVAMARGFAPFIVAVLLAGRTGSAIAAELSTMEMRQENDVLRVMGISPVRHLVVPRLLAITVVMPSLTLIATAAGTFGGLIVTMFLDPDWRGAVEWLFIDLTFADMWLGAVKAVLFGWVILIASAFTGFHSGEGALSIGTAATRAVVGSIFWVMIVDSIVTTLWTMAQ